MGWGEMLEVTTLQAANVLLVQEVKDLEAACDIKDKEIEALRLVLKVNETTEHGTITTLKADIKKLEGNFSHFHVANHVDDACAVCGLDLRNEVHLRSR